MRTMYQYHHLSDEAKKVASQSENVNGFFNEDGTDFIISTTIEL